MSWEKLTLEHLRAIARHYNKDVKIMAIGKMKKNDLIEELKKHLTVDYDKGEIHHKTENKKYNFRLEDEKKEEKKPKKKEEKKPEAKTNPPPLPPKAEDKSYKKEVVAKKVVQARAASADASAIKAPDIEVEKDTRTELIINMTEKIPVEMNEKIKEYIPQALLEGHSPNLARVLIEGARQGKDITTFNTVDYMLLTIIKDGEFKIKKEHTSSETPRDSRGILLTETNPGFDMLEKLFKIPVRISVHKAGAGMGHKGGTYYQVDITKTYNLRTKAGKDERAKDIQTLKSEAEALHIKLRDLKARGIMTDLAARAKLESNKKSEARAKIVAATSSTVIPVGSKNAILVPLRELKPYLLNSGRGEEGATNVLSKIAVWLHRRHNIPYGNPQGAIGIRDTNPQIWNNTVIKVYKGKTNTITFSIND